MGLGGIGEIGKVVDKGLNGNSLFTMLEVGEGALILAEGMQFGAKKATAGAEGALNFGKDGVEIGDVFENQITVDEVGGLRGTGPGEGEIGQGVSDGGGAEFLLSLPDHPF